MSPSTAQLPTVFSSPCMATASRTPALYSRSAPSLLRSDAVVSRQQGRTKAGRRKLLFAMSDNISYAIIGGLGKRALATENQRSVEQMFFTFTPDEIERIIIERIA